MIRRLAVFFLAASGCCLPAAADSAAIRADRVNVRATPSLEAEVLAWLKRGETVETLGPAKDGWVRITLPAKVAVWAYGPLIDTASRRVRAKDLNLRTGPGKNYGEIGKLHQGDIVTVIRESDGWLQIEPPAGLSGFIAANLAPAPEAVTETVARSETEGVPPAEPSPSPSSVPTKPVRAVSKNSQSTATGTPVMLGDPVPVATTPKARKEEPKEVTPTVFFTAPAPQVLTEASQPLIRYSDAVRVVVRVGRVVLSLDPESPSYYRLESLNRGEGSLGYLVSDDDSIKLGRFRSRIVRVTAGEYVDLKRPTETVLRVKSVVDDPGF